MKWTSFVSEEPFLEGALREASAAIDRQLDGVSPDLVLVFVSPQHGEDYGELAKLLRALFPVAVILGCSGGGVVGGGREVERAAAVSVTAAVLPGVRVSPFHLDSDQTDLLVQEPALWREFLDLEGQEPVQFLILPDPDTCDARSVLWSLDQEFPVAAKCGGLASGAERPGENALFLNDELYAEGLVGVALAGALDVDTIVAQGCRPVGSPLFVTQAFGNRILQLDGRRASEVLAEVYEQLETPERAMFHNAPLLGMVMNSGRESYQHGDFLVRNIVGMDAQTGVISIGEAVAPGDVVQFHLRDADASARDLEQLLRDHTEQADYEPAAAALLFSCLGRGEMFYGQVNHDSAMIADLLGPLPIGGFFCSGEIGPVCRKTYLHGYTSSIVLIRSPQEGED